VSTDSELIQQSKVTPSAFGGIYDRHAATVHRYAASRVGATLADDVMSETFLVAFDKRHAFDDDQQSAGPWLLGIATNILHRLRRSEARRLKATMKAATPEVVPDEILAIMTRIDAESAVRSVAAALRQMPSIDRDTIMLFAISGLSYDEIAVAMRVPLGTVRSRLNRARRTLRAATGLTDTEDKGYGRADTAARNA